MGIHIYTNFICVLIAFIGIRKFDSLKLGIWLLIVGSAVVDFASNYLQSHYHVNAGIVYTIWYPMEVASFLWIYRTHKSGNFPTLWLYVGISFCIIAIVASLPQAMKGHTPLWPLVTCGVLLLMISYLQLRKTISLEGFVMRNSLHWVLAANVFYSVLMIQSLASVFYFAFIENNYPLSSKFYMLNHVGYMGWSVLLTTGILMGNKHGK